MEQGRIASSFVLWHAALPLMLGLGLRSLCYLGT
jgi:hypothetical protein